MVFGFREWGCVLKKLYTRALEGFVKLEWVLGFRVVFGRDFQNETKLDPKWWNLE